MDCLPPTSAFGSELFCCRSRAAFRALLALCACILFSSDALAMDAGDTLRVMTYNIQYAYCFGGMFMHFR